jgi:putative DNA primase/helicase
VRRRFWNPRGEILKKHGRSAALSKEGFYCFTSSGLKEATRGIDFDQALNTLDQADAFAKKGAKQRAVTTRTPEGRSTALYWINPAKLNVE